MKFQFVTIPTQGSANAQAELNQFVAAHRVLSVDRQLINDGARSFWAVCVAYEETTSGTPEVDGAKKARVDYKELLSEAEFGVFAKLRDLRKQWAGREGVPPYAVFTNEQLADIVRRNVSTVTDLSKVDGIGSARLDKYGKALVDALKSARVTTPQGA